MYRAQVEELKAEVAESGAEKAKIENTLKEAIAKLQVENDKLRRGTSSGGGL